MTVHYVTAVAAARLQEVIDAIDAGSGPGVLVIGTSALSGATGVLVSVTLDDPCGSVTTRTLNLSGTPLDATAAAAGTAAKAELRDSDDNVVCDGLTVGVIGSGANILMDTTSLVIGRPVRLVSGAIVHP